MGSGLRRGVFYIVLFLDASLALSINPPDSIRAIAQSFNTSLSVLESSASSLNASANSRFGCSGRQYGYGLDVLSCLDAYGHLDRRSTAPQSWGPRRPNSNYDVGLPRSYWSSDLSCVIIPILKPPYFSARASMAEVAAGASVIIQQCANKERNQGGLAMDISPGQHLGVIVAKYRPPPVQCFGNIGSENLESSCQELLDRMDTSAMGRVFAESGTPPVIRIPRTITSADRKCFLTITTTGLSDVESWERIWEDASIATAKCIRDGKIGVVAGLGIDRRLQVIMSGQQIPPITEQVATA